MPVRWPVERRRVERRKVDRRMIDRRMVDRRMVDRNRRRDKIVLRKDCRLAARYADYKLDRTGTDRCNRDTRDCEMGILDCKCW